MYSKQFQEELLIKKAESDPGILDSIQDDYFTPDGKPKWITILLNLGILLARIFILISQNKRTKRW